MILSNDFSGYSKMTMWFLTFLLLMRCIIFIDLHYIEPQCEIGMNPNCHGVLYFFIIIFLDLVSKNFVENSCIYIHQNYWPIIFFIGSIFV